MENLVWFGFEVPKHGCHRNDGNFKSTTLVRWGLNRRAGGQGRALRGGGRRRRRWQVTRNGRAGTRPRLDQHRTAMQFNEALDQGQAEPSPGFPRVRIAALALLEDPLLI